MKLNDPEGATPLDPTELEGLKIAAISTRKELDRYEAANILEAYDWLDQQTNKKVLTEEFVWKLHKKMFGKVWSWAGQVRTTEKNIGCPPHQIRLKLRLLLDDVQFWIAHQSFSIDEILVRFHHRLVAIHLFSNGNGRHARLICDVLAEKLGVEPFSWGNQNLNTANDTRNIYIRALKLADLDNYQALLNFVRT